MRKGEFLKSEASAKCGNAFLKVAFRKMRKLAAEGRGTLQNMEKLLLVPGLAQIAAKKAVIAGFTFTRKLMTGFLHFLCGF